MNNITEDTSVSSKNDTEQKKAQETLEAQAHGGALKRKTYPTYEGFEGKFSKIAELRDRLPAFRDFYLERRFIGKKKVSAIKIVDMFNEITPPGDFFPHSAMFSKWRKVWDAESAGILKDAETRLKERDERKLLDPNAQLSMVQLEEGMHTLGAELANDAMQTLRDTQEREEYFDDEVVVKRKAYALNVFTYVTKAAHSRAALDLKRRGEARETAGFMLDILRRASTGKLSDEELDLLRGTIRTQNHGDGVGLSTT